MEKETKKTVKNKAETRLKTATKRIIKRSKQKPITDSDLAVFAEIKSILEAEEQQEAITRSQLVIVPPREAIDPVGLNAFDVPAAFTLFNEESLKLANFVPKEQTFFGIPIGTRSDKFFRNLLLSQGYVLRGNNKPVSERISLYVFYLAAVSTNPKLVTRCLDFLVTFPLTLTAKEILPVFLNFGVPIDAVKEPFEEFSIPDFLLPGIDRREDFPAFNIVKVAKFLSFCVEKNLLEINEETKCIVLAVARLTQDPRVRNCSLLTPLSHLLSALIFKAEDQLEVSVLASWLLLSELPLIQLDICRTGNRPLSTNLQHTLILLSISSILKRKLEFPTPIQIQDFKYILRHINHKKSSLSLIDIRVITELLTAALPVITAKYEDIRPITDQICLLETMFVNCPDSSELVQASSATAKLQSLVMIKGGSRLMAKANSILCSPSRPVRT